MQANLDMKNERYKHAIRALKRVPEQDPDFLTEIIAPLVQCYREMNAMDECIQYLHKILLNQFLMGNL